MTLEEFKKFVETEMLPEAFEIMDSKGLSYSGLEDKLGNFKRVANNCGLSPEQVWFVYASKHWDAICSYLRKEYKDSENIKGRILDMINYLLLFSAILKEKGELDK